jgi:hypothetical protein
VFLSGRAASRGVEYVVFLVSVGRAIGAGTMVGRPIPVDRCSCGVVVAEARLAAKSVRKR